MGYESGGDMSSSSAPGAQRSSLVLGLGYVGAALARQLLHDGQTVVGVDNLFSTDRRAIDELHRQRRFQFIQGSVTDPSALDAAFAAARQTDVVYLLAAQASGHPLAAPSEYTEETNLRGPRLVVEAMQRAGARRLVYASSLKILGEPLPPVVGEAAAYGVQTDLAHLSKVYVEKYLEMAAHRADDLSAIAVRLGLVYGVGPVFKRDPRYMTAPNKFCQQVIRGETIEVRSSGPVGLIHVQDAARALRAGAKLAPDHGYRAINAPVEVSSIAAVARAVAEAARRRGLEAVVALHPHPNPLPQGEGTDPSLALLDGGREPLVDTPSPHRGRGWGERSTELSAPVLEDREGQELPRVVVESSLTMAGFLLTHGIEEGIDTLFDHLLAVEQST